MVLEQQVIQRMPVQGSKEQGYWNGLKRFVRKNKVGLSILVAGTIADIATTALVLHGNGSEFSNEMQPISKYVMDSLGTFGGQAALKSAFLVLYIPAAHYGGKMLDRIFKSNSSEEKLMAFGGYTQLTVAGINLASYFGVNI